MPARRDDHPAMSLDGEQEFPHAGRALEHYGGEARVREPRAGGSNLGTQLRAEDEPEARCAERDGAKKDEEMRFAAFGVPKEEKPPGERCHRQPGEDIPPRHPSRFGHHQDQDRDCAASRGDHKPAQASAAPGPDHQPRSHLTHGQDKQADDQHHGECGQAE
jgi:hypothetical protein